MNLRRCRCEKCRAAWNRYARRPYQARTGGGWRPADKARRHLLKLANVGVGVKAVADASDLSWMTILQIRLGRRRRIQRETERRIMTITSDAVADYAVIPAGPTWKRIGELLGEGFLRKEIVSRIGLKGEQLRVGRQRVRAITAAKVERFHRLTVGY